MKSKYARLTCSYQIEDLWGMLALPLASCPLDMLGMATIMVTNLAYKSCLQIQDMLCLPYKSMLYPLVTPCHALQPMPNKSSICKAWDLLALFALRACKHKPLQIKDMQTMPSHAIPSGWQGLHIFDL